MNTQASAGRRAHADLADLNRLIQFVEQWRRLAHERAPDPADARRLANAEAVLRKLRAGVQLATSANDRRASPASRGRLLVS